MQRNCECQMIGEGCENNERDSDSSIRVRDMPVAFYHHTGNEVDGEVQEASSRLCKCGGECPPITVGPKAGGR